MDPLLEKTIRIHDAMLDQAVARVARDRAEGRVPNIIDQLAAASAAWAQDHGLRATKVQEEPSKDS